MTYLISSIFVKMGRVINITFNNIVLVMTDFVLLYRIMKEFNLYDLLERNVFKIFVVQTYLIFVIYIRLVQINILFSYVGNYNYLAFFGH